MGILGALRSLFREQSESYLVQLGLASIVAGDLVVILDPQGRVEWISDTFTQRLGYTLQEVEGKPLLEVLRGAETDPEAIRRIREFIAQCMPFREPLYIKKKDGTMHWYFFYAGPLMNGAGQVDHIVIYGVDIRDQVEKEQRIQELMTALAQKQEALEAQNQELQLLNEELIQSQEELRVLLEQSEARAKEIAEAQRQLRLLSLAATHSEAGVAILRRNFEVEWVNPAFTKLSGYGLEELRRVSAESPLAFFKHYMSGAPDQLQDLYIQLRQLRQPFQRELLAQRKDGTSYWVLTTIKPILDEVGEVEWCIVVQIDTTPYREQVLKAAAKAQALDESVRYAKRLQQAFLPSLATPPRGIKQVQLIYRPKTEIGGDFVWFAEGSEGLGLAVVDSTGHGVPGAMMGMAFRQLLDQVWRTVEGTLADCIERLHAQLSQLQEEAGILEGFEITLLHLTDQKLELFTTQAQPFFIQHVEGPVEVYKSKVGIGRDLAARGGTLNKGLFSFSRSEVSRVCLLTDGIVDQLGGAEHKRFGSQRLESLLRAGAYEDLRALQREILHALQLWQGEHEQTDDQLMVLLEV